MISGLVFLFLAALTANVVEVEGVFGLHKSSKGSHPPPPGPAPKPTPGASSSSGGDQALINQCRSYLNTATSYPPGPKKAALAALQDFENAIKPSKAKKSNDHDKCVARWKAAHALIDLSYRHTATGMNIATETGIKIVEPVLSLVTSRNPQISPRVKNAKTVKFEGQAYLSHPDNADFDQLHKALDELFTACSNAAFNNCCGAPL